MKKDIVLVLGNGFDLDLGWHTSYSDFAKSDFWPFASCNSYLGGYLNTHSIKTNWFDLEASIKEYVNPSVIIKRNEAIDIQHYNMLKESLSAYLEHEESKPINESSVSVYVMSVSKIF